MSLGCGRCQCAAAADGEIEEDLIRSAYKLVSTMIG